MGVVYRCDHVIMITLKFLGFVYSVVTTLLLESVFIILRVSDGACCLCSHFS